MSNTSSIAATPTPHQAAPIREKAAQHDNHGPQATKAVKAAHPPAPPHAVSKPTETKGNHVNQMA